MKIVAYGSASDSFKVVPNSGNQPVPKCEIVHCDEKAHTRQKERLAQGLHLVGGKVERGEHMPMLALILKIARALGCSLTELMAETESRMAASES